MMTPKLSPCLVLCLACHILLLSQVQAQEGSTITSLPIKLPRPSFTGTPLNYKSLFLEPPTLRKRPSFLAPAGTENVAFGKTVTASTRDPLAGTLDMIVDGEKGFAERFQVHLPFGSQWVQIDLGAEHEVFAIVVWHYHASDRVYFDFEVKTALDEDCTRGVTTLYNNDRDNSSGLGDGKDK